MILKTEIIQSKNTKPVCKYQFIFTELTKNKDGIQKIYQSASKAEEEGKTWFNLDGK